MCVFDSIDGSPHVQCPVNNDDGRVSCFLMAGELCWRELSMEASDGTGLLEPRGVQQPWSRQRRAGEEEKNCRIVGTGGQNRWNPREDADRVGFLPKSEYGRGRKTYSVCSPGSRRGASDLLCPTRTPANQSKPPMTATGGRASPQNSSQSWKRQSVTMATGWGGCVGVQCFVKSVANGL